MAPPKTIVSWRGPLLKTGTVLFGAPIAQTYSDEEENCRMDNITIAKRFVFRLCFARREAIGTSSIVCPVCHASKIRRSRRRSVSDYLFGFAGSLPWRCGSCALRFYARPMPFRTFLYAHCRICGNLELQRISAERMQGIMPILGRILGIPALRCEPCRHKFFSMRPLRPEERPVAISPSE